MPWATYGCHLIEETGVQLTCAASYDVLMVQIPRHSPNKHITNFTGQNGQKYAQHHVQGWEDQHRGQRERERERGERERRERR